MRSLLRHTRRVIYSISSPGYNSLPKQIGGFKSVYRIAQLCTDSGNTLTPAESIPEESKNTSEVPEISLDQYRINIRARIFKARQEQNYNKLCEAYLQAKSKDITLEGSDYITILKAYTTYTPKHRFFMDKEAFNVYDLISSCNVATIDVFEHMIMLCKYHRDAKSLLPIYKSFVERFQARPSHLAKCIDAFIHCEDDAMAMKHYTTYRSSMPQNTDDATEKNSDCVWPPLAPEIYIKLCQLLSVCGEKLQAVQILEDLGSDVSTEDLCQALQTKPSVRKRMFELVNTALIQYDLQILQYAMNWCFTAQLEFDSGLTAKIFEVSAAMSRPDIISLASAFVERSGRALSPTEHLHVIIANIRGGLLEKAIEAMVIAEAAGVDLCGQRDSDPENSSIAMPAYVQESFSKLIRTPSDLDQLYFALVDLMQHNIRPPVLALNSVIIGAGKTNSLDKAFSMMQEFEPVFHTKPNHYTYRALLDSVGRSRSPKVPALLTIMQEMDSAGFSPDSNCYSILIETMLLVKDTSGLDDILEHMEEEGIVPSMRTLRRLALFFMREGESDRTEHFCEIIRKQSKRVLPEYFRKRLKVVSLKMGRGTES
mmetsp:Transcript_16589/g.24961  ORF Transcript_16589/g.24961 Transcript_16589/m.24961 type:complete len:597 (-) Transcript_16589:116-1906(-)